MTDRSSIDDVIDSLAKILQLNVSGFKSMEFYIDITDKDTLKSFTDKMAKIFVPARMEFNTTIINTNTLLVRASA